MVWFTSSKVYIGLSNGSGGFSSIPGFSGFSGSVYGYDIADSNNDGHTDIIYPVALGAGSDGALQIMLGDGTGSFILYTLNKADYAASFTSFLNPMSAGIADIDNDGKNDLVFYNNTSDATKGLWVGLRSSAHGTNPVYSFTMLNSSTMSSSIAFSLRFGDYNADGKVDMLVAHQSGVLLFTGDGTGAFTQSTISSSGFTYKVFFIDMNNDGKPDIVANPGGSVKVYYQ